MTEKKILDVTCGARSIWFDKHNPAAIYCDKRREMHHHIPAEKVWRAIGQKPLFGHHSGKQSRTFWACYMQGIQ